MISTINDDRSDLALATPLLWGHQLMKRSGKSDHPQAPLVAGVHAFIKVRVKPCWRPRPPQQALEQCTQPFAQPWATRPFTRNRPPLHHAALCSSLCNADPATERCAAPPRNTL